MAPSRPTDFRTQGLVARFPSIVGEEGILVCRVLPQGSLSEAVVGRFGTIKHQTEGTRLRDKRWKESQSVFGFWFEGHGWIGKDEARTPE